MSAVETKERRDDGFELDGVFYRWSVTDTGKDLLLLDRFTGGMPIAEFFDGIENEPGFTGRAPVLLSLIATSVRAQHPDWSVDRVARKVEALSLEQVEFIDGEAEAQPVPPAGGGETPPETSAEPKSVSSSSSTPQES